MKKEKKKIEKIELKKKEDNISPYKKYLNSKNQAYEKYKEKYFEYHDDVKDKTHKIIDW